MVLRKPVGTYGGLVPLVDKAKAIRWRNGKSVPTMDYIVGHCGVVGAKLGENRQPSQKTSTGRLIMVTLRSYKCVTPL